MEIVTPSCDCESIDNVPDGSSHSVIDGIARDGENLPGDLIVVA